MKPRINIQDLDEYLEHIDEALIITGFTSKSKNNQTYSDIHTNISRSLDISKKNIIEIFIDKLKTALTDTNSIYLDDSFFNH